MVNVRNDGDFYHVGCARCGEQFEVPVSDLSGILQSVPDEVFLRHSLNCICEFPGNESAVKVFSVNT